MSGKKITSLKLHFPLLSGYPAKWEDKKINAFLQHIGGPFRDQFFFL